MIAWVSVSIRPSPRPLPPQKAIHPGEALDKGGADVGVVRDEWGCHSKQVNHFVAGGGAEPGLLDEAQEPVIFMGFGEACGDGGECLTVTSMFPQQSLAEID